ncbi:family 90 glycosyltransferase [Cryphonectria parasitica EP155]|uniref:Family 90 glycosyltransferase n=1 Tax=Cryphonectria parasitica (strain ATCC 38755 / EP155) TaxID=660469 RepID=A0A9P4XZ38_CRYP1|nr:family 90 glycosyltransferase [Cryphonectria parasitica EP155]KAF3763422.1 family 90 glycosyltransferase [Cryphonectria parasitica EP155]
MRWGSVIPHKMRSPAFPPRRPSAILRYLIPAFLIITLFYYLKPAREPPTPAPGVDLARPAPQASRPEHDENGQLKQQSKNNHPIDRLIENAQKEFQDTLAGESHSLAEAAAAYRKKRGRHPPPGFDQWYKYAQERNAVMVESFWDQIYHDLEPFWALPAGEIRKGAWDYEMTINVRSGVASAGSDWFWTQIWLSLVQTIQHLLPDMDIALNAMDEPRLVVPWEKMNEYMNKAAAARGMVPAKDAINNFEVLAPPGQGRERDVELPEKNWEGTKPYWGVAQRGCAPESPTRNAENMTDFDHPPTFTHSFAEPHMYKGFVSNYTMSTSICHQPDLQGLNGMFIEPLTVSATRTLFPMFGGSKLSVNNEILLPAPMYWNEEERFTAGGDTGVDWPLKKDGVVWRGVATGGKNRPNNWKAFQRHRFVAMNNATKIERAEDWTEKPVNFELPSPTYGLAAQRPVSADSPKTKLGEWVGNWSDVAFVDLMCEQEEAGGQCHYTSPHFNVQEGIRLAEQFDWKYLPDIDGNSFSGRYLGFLRSTSLPIKATVYREWHDSRLVAWKHFVPMDNRYSDWFGIMEYFLGYGAERPAHDAAAEKIASDGKAWAEKVLRREDMQIYVLRLLLEYARVSDERREKMGWVGDLTA